MEFINQVGDERVSKDFFAKFLIILSPFAPHIAEELWHLLKFKGLVVQQPWPKFDPAKIENATVKYIVQVNGKMRGSFEIAKIAKQEEVEAAARKIETVSKNLTAEVKKIIFVPNRLINFVI